MNANTANIVKVYEPIWAIMHKIRTAMGNRDSHYTLSGIIELDEGFFTTETSEKEKNNPLKRGRGSQKKTKVLVMAESVSVEKNDAKKYKDKPRKVNHIKMFVIDDLKSETIDNKVVRHIEKTSIIDSDDSTSYTNLSKLIAEHRPKVIPKELIGRSLPWVHLAISNAKRLFLDVFHDIKPEYLQNYLSQLLMSFLYF